jgi:hypothetical protein
MKHAALQLDIDEGEFAEDLLATLARGGVGLLNAVRGAVTACMSRGLDQMVAAGNCMCYAFRNGCQSHVLSLKEAASNSGFDFWYLDVQIDFPLGTEISEFDVRRPKTMQWLPIDYGGGVRRTFQFKHITMRTRQRCEIKILHPQVPAALFRSVLRRLCEDCPCSKKHLAAVPAPAWDWRQAFGCVICGKRFLCECFRTAVQKAAEAEKRSILPDENDAEREELNRFVDKEYSAEYRRGICHLCTGRPSNLLYCSPMYGSAVKVHYGAYVEKFAIAEGLSPRDAENRVRGVLGLPRIGEGWLNETQLFRLLGAIFPERKVIREARPAWLGNQRLDFFIPDLSLAVEYQGEQHFKAVERFGGESALRKTRLRDARKRRICEENGVRLVYFTYADDLSVERVEKRLRNFTAEH